MKHTNPIFFIGQGRSGTTVLFEYFVKHDDIAYMSNYTNKFFFPISGIAHRLIHNQGIKDQYNKTSIINKFLPKPAESYETWQKLCGEKFLYTFLKDCRATDKEKRRTLKYISNVCKYQGKRVFATKLTGPPRINYLKSIADEAIFINVVRDPRAVVASLINVGFWIKKGNEPFWEDCFSKEHYKIWESYDKSPIAKAALECLAIYEQTQAEKAGANVLTVKYEDFAEDPLKVLENIYDFTNLKKGESYKEYLHSRPVINMNKKYKTRLTEADIKIIENICSAYMDEYNYK